MNKIIVNQDIELLPLAMTHAGDIFNAIDRQREYLGEWLPFIEYTRDISDTVSFIESVVNVAEEEREQVFIIQRGGVFAGLAGFKATDRMNRKTEIGYWLCETFQGKGIMTAVVMALCDVAFDRLGINRIQIKCAVGNDKSRNIPLRLGFSLEGIERQGELFPGDTYVDAEVYSLLKKERG